MIATAEDPVSPHESSSKGAAFPGASMARINAIKQEIQQEKAKEQDRDDHDDQEDNESGSDESDYEDDEEERHSADFQQLTLDSLDGEGLTDEKPASADTKVESKSGEAAPAPVKRVLRRKRKRMSEDERRIRHREVQRQFMKRKRARLGEMRKVLRGLEAHHRLVKASNERTMLEKENAELAERLAAPGSGWVWDDAPVDTQEAKRQSSPDPSVVYLVPEQGHLAFHHQAPHHTLPDPHYDSHHGGMQLHWHYPPVYHAPLPGPHHLQSPHHPHHHQGMTSLPHGMAHRPAVPGVTLPWDDILDAVTGESVDISF